MMKSKSTPYTLSKAGNPINPREEKEMHHKSKPESGTESCMFDRTKFAHTILDKDEKGEIDGEDEDEDERGEKGGECCDEREGYVGGVGKKEGDEDDDGGDRMKD